MKTLALLVLSFLISQSAMGADQGLTDKIKAFEAAKTAFDAQPSSIELCEKAALASFGLVRADQLGYLITSIDLFSKALKLSDQARFRSYLGSCYMIQAREAKEVIDKVDFVNKGLKELDLAVTMAPKEFLCLYIRAESTITLPDFFNRLDQVTKDLDVLLALYEKSPKDLEKFMSPKRLFELKASELELRKKPVAANTYRKKAKELQ